LTNDCAGAASDNANTTAITVAVRLPPLRHQPRRPRPPARISPASPPDSRSGNAGSLHYEKPQFQDDKMDKNYP
jgi:hypothetical protein